MIFRFLFRRLTWVILAALIAGAGGFFDKTGLFKQDTAQTAAYTGDPVLTDVRAQHILHGNKTGGGHLYGTKAPCESEFPKNWNADKIITTVQQLAANDNMDWKQQKNGYYVTTAKTEGLDIKIVIDGKKQNIITAYPTNTKRNACPSKRKPANDNYNR